MKSRTLNHTTRNSISGGIAFSLLLTLHAATAVAEDGVRDEIPRRVDAARTANGDIEQFDESRGSTMIMRLHAEAKVKSNLVYLSDCAEIVTDDRDLRRQLEHLTLFPAPLAGRQIVIDYEWFRNRLQAHGINLARVEFTGSPSIVIHGREADKAKTTQPIREKAKTQPTPINASQPVTVTRTVTSHERGRAEQDAIALIRAELLKYDDSFAAMELRVEIDDEGTRLLNACDRRLVQIHSAEPAEEIDGTYLQRWRLSVAAVEGRQQLVDVDVEILPPPRVLVLTHDVPAGYILQPDDLEWGISTRGGVETVGWEDLLGKETTHAIRKDQPLFSRDVRAPILVKNGEIVSVTVRYPGIRVRREFKSNAQGGLGDVITLTSLDGRERIRAKVTATHEAEIIPETSASNTDVNGSIREPRRIAYPPTGPATSLGRNWKKSKETATDHQLSESMRNE